MPIDLKSEADIDEASRWPCIAISRKLGVMAPDPRTTVTARAWHRVIHDGQSFWTPWCRSAPCDTYALNTNQAEQIEGSDESHGYLVSYTAVISHLTRHYLFIFRSLGAVLRGSMVVSAGDIREDKTPTEKWTVGGGGWWWGEILINNFDFVIMNSKKRQEHINDANQSLSELFYIRLATYGV